MKCLFVFVAVFMTTTLFAWDYYREYDFSDPIARSMSNYKPVKENIEGSPYFQRCLTRLEARPWLHRTPKGTERFTLRECVRFEESFNGLR